MNKLLFVGLFFLSLTTFAEPIRVSSKIFTEGYLLGEVLAQKLESQNFPVERMLGLGATGVTEEAMKNGKVDLIVDYTGSLAQAHLSGKTLAFSELKSELEKKGYVISNSLGFNNTYTFAVRPEWAAENKLKNFSDLKKLAKIKASFTPEFTSRPENWSGLKQAYHFSNFEILEMDHQLAYKAVSLKQTDVVEAYSTDAKLQEYKLITLQDDLKYFPDYSAVIVAKKEWVEKNPLAWKVLQELEGKISDTKMTELNSAVDNEKRSFSDVASEFLQLKTTNSSLRQEIVTLTMEHLYLTLLPVLFAILLGIPMGYWASRSLLLQNWFGTLATVVQTIPGLALLTFLIPLTGIGSFSAMIVLFLYSLLPIFINSTQGFRSVTPVLDLSCRSLRMTKWQRLYWVEWDMALPMILTGLQTALVITVGNATLAALIGAGGYGKKIIAGLAVNDVNVVLIGAVPSALMALALYGIMEIFIRRVNR